MLSTESSYQKKVIQFLKTQGIADVDFKDAKITGYTNYALPVQTLDNIEENVQNLLIPSFTQQQITGFFQKISPEDKRFFQFKKESFIRLQKENNKISRDTLETTIEKFEKMISLVVGKWQGQIEEIEGLEHLVKQKDLQITNNEKQLQEKTLLLAEKEQLIAEKDHLLSKEDRKIQQKARLLSRKNEQLKQKDKLLTENELQLAEMKEKIKQQGFQLNETKRKMMEMEHELEKIQHSYTYRIGRVIASPLKTVKRLITKLSRLTRPPGDIKEPVSTLPGKYERPPEIRQRDS